MLLVFLFYMLLILSNYRLQVDIKPSPLILGGVNFSRVELVCLINDTTENKYGCSKYEAGKEYHNKYHGEIL